MQASEAPRCTVSSETMLSICPVAGIACPSWCRMHSRSDSSLVVSVPAQIVSKMDAEDKSTIETAVDEAIAWLDTNGLAEVRHTTLCWPQRRLSSCLLHFVAQQHLLHTRRGHVCLTSVCAAARSLRNSARVLSDATALTNPDCLASLADRRARTQAQGAGGHLLAHHL